MHALHSFVIQVHAQAEHSQQPSQQHAAVFLVDDIQGSTVNLLLWLCTCAGEVKGLKAQCNSLADAAQAEKFELLAAKQENERLQDQIVQVRANNYKKAADLLGTALFCSSRRSICQAFHPRCDSLPLLSRLHADLCLAVS